MLLLVRHAVMQAGAGVGNTALAAFSEQIQQVGHRDDAGHSAVAGRNQAADAAAAHEIRRLTDGFSFVDGRDVRAHDVANDAAVVRSSRAREIAGRQNTNNLWPVFDDEVMNAKRAHQSCRLIERHRGRDGFDRFSHYFADSHKCSRVAVDAADASTTHTASHLPGRYRVAAR